MKWTVIRNEDGNYQHYDFKTFRAVSAFIRVSLNCNMDIVGVHKYLY